MIIEDLIKQEGEKFEIKRPEAQETELSEQDQDNNPEMTHKTIEVDSDMEIADLFDNLLNGGNWAMFGNSLK